jgi:TolB-like protein
MGTAYESDFRVQRDLAPAGVRYVLEGSVQRSGNRVREAARSIIAEMEGIKPANAQRHCGT